MWLVIIAVFALIIVAQWIVYSKADQPGWGVIIPIYNLILLVRIVGRSGWWVVLLLIPYISFVFLIVICVDLARSFVRGSGFGVGLAFLPMIFFPILAFGDSRYIGPNGGSQAAVITV